MNLRDRVNESTPEWANEILMPWSTALPDDLGTYRRQTSWTHSGSVNAFSIVGTAHPSYRGASWLNLLQHGKRMTANLALHARNPGYYSSVETKQPKMHLTSVDGTHWYVATDGNHRSCIARFHFAFSGETMIHGLELESIAIDHEFRTLHHLISDVIESRDLNFDVVHTNSLVSRRDGAGWKIDTHSNALKVSEGHEFGGLYTEID